MAKKDIDNQTLLEMVSDPAIHSILESLRPAPVIEEKKVLKEDIEASAANPQVEARRKKIREALRKLKESYDEDAQGDDEVWEAQDEHAEMVQMYMEFIDSPFPDEEGPSYQEFLSWSADYWQPEELPTAEVFESLVQKEIKKQGVKLVFEKKKKALLEQDEEMEDEEEDEEVAADDEEMDSEEDDFFAEMPEEGDEEMVADEAADPVLSALQQARQFLDQAEAALGGGDIAVEDEGGEMDFDEIDLEGDIDLEGEEEAVEEDLDLFEKKKRRSSLQERIAARIKEKRIERIREKIAARRKVLQEKKVSSTSKKKMTPTARKRVAEKVAALIAQRKKLTEDAIAKKGISGGEAKGGKFPSAPKKVAGGHQKQAGSKTEYPKKAKAAQKGNIKPSHGSAGDGKGQTANVKPKGFPGQAISRQKEARREAIRNRVRELLAEKRSAE